MHFVKHVIVGRDGVKEILDDAHVIIDSSLVRRNSNPRTSHASHIIWNNLVDFVPNTSMMTTSVASKRKHRKPRLKHWSMKAETLGDLLFESFIFQVPVVHIHATHWEKFTKDPCWWKRFCICSSLATVTFENGSQLKTIEGGYPSSGTFADCTALTSIEIPASVETIEAAAFKGCSSLATVTFEKGSQLKTIGGGGSSYYGAFGQLKNLMTVDMSACTQVKTIGESAFDGDSELRLFKIGTETPPTCGRDAFSGINPYSVLKVPSGCADAYKAKSGWNNFASITGLDE